MEYVEEAGAVVRRAVENAYCAARPMVYVPAVVYVPCAKGLFAAAAAASCRRCPMEPKPFTTTHLYRFALDTFSGLHVVAHIQRVVCAWQRAAIRQSWNGADHGRPALHVHNLNLIDVYK